MWFVWASFFFKRKAAGVTSALWTLSLYLLLLYCLPICWILVSRGVYCCSCFLVISKYRGSRGKGIRIKLIPGTNLRITWDTWDTRLGQEPRERSLLEHSHGWSPTNTIEITKFLAHKKMCRELHALRRGTGHTQAT